MIHLTPEVPHDNADEKKRMREVIISNISAFFIAVTLIRMG